MVDVPSSGTRLLGRDHEVELVGALLRGGDVRLVTVTGPGGVGKTRLAIEVARLIGDELCSLHTTTSRPVDRPRLARDRRTGEMQPRRTTVGPAPGARWREPRL
jgi:replication-associated recombination protein RarA